jgi:hypothetical protein
MPPGGTDTILFNDEHNSGGRPAFNATTRPAPISTDYTNSRASPQISGIAKVHPSPAGAMAKISGTSERIRGSPGGKDSITFDESLKAVPMSANGRRFPPGGKETTDVPWSASGRKFPPGGTDHIDFTAPPQQMATKVRPSPGGTDSITFQEKPGTKAKIIGMSERICSSPGGKDSITFDISLKTVPMPSTGRRCPPGGKDSPATLTTLSFAYQHSTRVSAQEYNCGRLIQSMGCVPELSRREKAGGFPDRTSMKTVLCDQAARTHQRTSSPGRASSMRNVLSQEPPSSQSNVRVRYAQGATTFTLG